MKSKVNKILGWISFAAAAGMIGDILYCYLKYHSITSMQNIRACAIMLLIGAALMAIHGISLMKTKSNRPAVRIAFMIIILLGAVYGTACVNSMLDYVANPPSYESIK